LISFFLIISSFLFSQQIFRVPEIVYSEDNIFSLKDIFPEILQDRIISYIINDSIQYDRVTLQRTLTGFLNIYYNDYELIFESDIIVIKKIEEVFEEEIIEIEKNIEKIVKNYDEELEILSITSRNIPKNISSFNVNSISLNRDNLYISMSIRDSSNKLFYSNYIIKVAKYENVLVFSENVSRNSLVTLENTKESSINILELAFIPIKSENFLFNKYSTSKNMIIDEILNPIYLRKIPDVKSGDIIPVIVKYENIEVKTWGRVMSNSNYGETISVRNIETGTTITGVLKEGPVLLVSIGGVE
jgi:flagella basal body P-ring formation protein FlgA